MPAKTVTVTLDEDTLITLTQVAKDEDRTKAVQAARVLRQWARSMNEAPPVVAPEQPGF